MSMFSPPRREKARPGDSDLPKGDCRYILLHPEMKGLRCACVGFALNRSIPGSSCDCGHQACYHAPEREAAGSVDRQELDALKEKIVQLQEELNRERLGGGGGLTDRLIRLEELVDKNKGECDVEFKSVYRGIGGLWHNVGVLNKRVPYYDDHIEGLVDDVQRIRNRLIEVDDASMRVEDRVEALENPFTPRASKSGRRRKASTPPTSGLDAASDSAVKTEEDVPTTCADPASPPPDMATDEPSRIQSFRERVSSVGSGSQSWTVHVSLLPASSQPFPFEKDTAAYKRCLSRGLHRIIVIPDSDSVSFKTAVSESFSEVLRGRPWQPLVAKICDAKNLRGLPMIRKLPSWLIGSDYDVDFLTRNCAVCDESGKINDLYIAMEEHTISWPELHTVTPYIPGLEASWIHDHYLDGPCLESDSGIPDAQTDEPGSFEKLPAAGDIVTTWSPSSARMKRNATEISRTPSFGSSTDQENSRSKIRRPRLGGSVEVDPRRVEAV